MSRPISNNIYYPFIAKDQDKTPIFGIREAIFDITTRGVQSQQYTEDIPLSVSLYSIESTTTSQLLTFKAYIPYESGHYVSDIIFRINKAEGLGSVRSDDGRCFLFLDYSCLNFSDSSNTFSPSDYILEPCCVRWRYSSVSSIVFVNEQRLSDISDRVGLSDTIVKRFSGPGSVKLKDGYNVSLQYSNNTLGLLANPGEGMGLAPYNPWEDKDPPVYTQPLVTINGILPDGNGDIPVTSSESIFLEASGNELIVTDNSHGGV